MKIKLLIAAGDRDYAEYLSNHLSEKYADTFEVSVFSAMEHFTESVEINKYDAILMEPEFASLIDFGSAPLSLVLWDDSYGAADNIEDYYKIPKYQRISSIVRNVLENYAYFNVSDSDFETGKIRVTAVWSPQGGVGKTTVSLAYAANATLSGKKTVYLDLENFSSTSVYFSENGKSISRVFEKLDSDLRMLIKCIRQKDEDSGIHYFCGPDNYNEINALTPESIETLVKACARGADELVIDLSSQCDEWVQRVFDLAHNLLLVCDSSIAAGMKLEQFMNQHDVAERIRMKSVLVNNKDAKIKQRWIDKTIMLPLVQSKDPIFVYKTLADRF